jgi:hypothetical protein
VLWESVKECRCGTDEKRAAAARIAQERKVAAQASGGI